MKKNAKRRQNGELAVRFCLDLLNSRVKYILAWPSNARWLLSKSIDLKIDNSLKEPVTDEEYNEKLNSYTQAITYEAFWRIKGTYPLYKYPRLVGQARPEYLLLNEYGNWTYFRGGHGCVSVVGELRRYNSKKGVWRLINNPSIRITIIHRISLAHRKFEYLEPMLQVFKKNESLRSLFLREVIGPRCVASCIVMPNQYDRLAAQSKSEKELIEILGFLEPKYRYDFLSQMDRKIINTRITNNTFISRLISLMPVEQQPLVITEIFKFRSLLHNCIDSEGGLKVLFENEHSKRILTVIPMGERSRFLAIRLDALKEGKNPWYSYPIFSSFLKKNFGALPKSLFSGKDI